MTFCKVLLTPWVPEHCGSARSGATAVLVAAAALLTSGCGAEELEAPTLRFTQNLVEYPVDLWNQGIGGTALVRVLVDEAGGVDSVTVAVSSGVPALDSAAVTGARQMEFEPARRGAEPVRVWARVPVHFAKEAAIAGEIPADDRGPGAPPGALNDA